jgi:hypothetical protein
MAEAGISNGQIAATVAEHTLLNGGFFEGLPVLLNRILIIIINIIVVANPTSEIL